MIDLPNLVCTSWPKNNGKMLIILNTLNGTADSFQVIDENFIENKMTLENLMNVGAICLDNRIMDA